MGPIFGSWIIFVVPDNLLIILAPLFGAIYVSIRIQIKNIPNLIINVIYFCTGIEFFYLNDLISLIENLGVFDFPLFI